ncbi:MAG: 3',5'-cyclic-AMP phosphodiesterase [Gammaproteobacteria bacterium]|nr:3',5'-cyclic-AMP phosphodiesterase [Gammaproteobacteria bacterium]
MTDVYRLLQFTDPHLYAERGGEMRGVRTLETLLATMRQARQRHWPPDAILVTGDIAQDESQGAYQLFRECFGALGVPIHCLPGNHDAPEFMQELLTQAPFGYCETLTLGDWCVPMLDSHTPGDAGGRLGQDQLDRLADLLNHSAGKHFLICLHHHPVSSGSRWLDTVALRNAADLWDIVEQHDHVRGLLWGHVHQEYDDRRNGVLLLATPSTCRQFKPNMIKFALDEDRPPAYRWLELYPDGNIITEVAWCDTQDPD